MRMPLRHQGQKYSAHRELDVGRWLRSLVGHVISAGMFLRAKSTATTIQGAFVSLSTPQQHKHVRFEIEAIGGHPNFASGETRGSETNGSILTDPSTQRHFSTYIYFQAFLFFFSFFYMCAHPKCNIYIFPKFIGGVREILLGTSKVL